jgi:hypothetical protein
VVITRAQRLKRVAVPAESRKSRQVAAKSHGAADIIALVVTEVPAKDQQMVLKSSVVWFIAASVKVFPKDQVVEFIGASVEMANVLVGLVPSQAPTLRMVLTILLPRNDNRLVEEATWRLAMVQAVLRVVVCFEGHVPAMAVH